jgi:hypothetical protein
MYRTFRSPLFPPLFKKLSLATWVNILVMVQDVILCPRPSSLIPPLSKKLSLATWETLQWSIES